MIVEQRRFERFAISENAVAVDSSGRTLGRVTMAGGGGMGIVLADPSFCAPLGQQLRITVVEPDTSIRHTIDAIVRYRQENTIGLEFVTGTAITER
jgi:hypothetical protein